MNITYPVSSRLKRLFLISTIGTLVWMLLMGLAVKPVNSRQIVSFELAKTPDVALKVINEWKEQDLIVKAKRSIYLDFVFLVLYCLSFSLGCLVISIYTGNHFLIQTGWLLSRLVPFAGLCDVIENLAMLKTLSGEVTVLPVAIAFWFASIKFGILAFSLLFISGCLIVGNVTGRIIKGA